MPAARRCCCCRRRRRRLNSLKSTKRISRRERRLSSSKRNNIGAEREVGGQARQDKTRQDQVGRVRKTAQLASQQQSLQSPTAPLSWDCLLLADSDATALNLKIRMGDDDDD